MPPARIAVLSFFSVFFVMRAIIVRAEGKKIEVMQRVRQYVKQELTTDNEVKKNVNEPLKTVVAFFSKVMPKRVWESVEAELIQADIPLKAEELAGINILTTVLPSMSVMLLSQNIFLALLLAIMGAFLPQFIIKNAKTKRVRQFNHQLGDALQIMANSLRAGFSFLQTMDTISKEMSEPLAQEFSRTLREMRLGTPTEEALQKMGNRIENDDLELIITAVCIQRQVGGNLAEVLDNIGATINERIRIKAEVKTLTAQGRISGLIVAVLPIFLMVFIAVMNPTYIFLLFTHPLGLMLCGGAIVSEIIGIIFIKKIVSIEF